MNPPAVTQQERVREAVQILSRISLPDFPADLMWLEEALKDDQTSFYDIIHFIENRFKLVEEVIHTANEVLVEMNNPVTTIGQAVNFLGADALHNLVISTHFKKLFSDNVSYQKVLEHSIWVAKAMALIERKTTASQPDFAYTLGLLHNLGALSLGVYDPKRYLEFFQKSRSFPRTALSREEERFGTNHCVVGVILGKRWNLSKVILEVIYRHHCADLETLKDNTTKMWVARLQIANALVDEVYYETYQTTEIKKSLLAAQHQLNVTRETYDALKHAFLKLS